MNEIKISEINGIKVGHAQDMAAARAARLLYVKKARMRGRTSGAAPPLQGKQNCLNP